MSAKRKTTFSVPEMRDMLGLKKTESYWLVHKNLFETVTVAGQMRIVRDSFEEWYENQTHYKKVKGPAPGRRLNAVSYSIQDIAEMLQVTTDTVYELLKKQCFEAFISGNEKRIRKTSFHKWLRNQKHYRTKEEREHDREAEESSMSIPEMGRTICIDRNEAYALVKKYPELNEINIAGQRRITKDSFERWYAGQCLYQKSSDMSQAEREEMQKTHKNDLLGDEIRSYNKKVCPDPLPKPWYTIKETANILSCSESVVERLIKAGEFHAQKVQYVWRIMREEIIWFMKERQIEIKGENEDGSDC